MVYGFLKVTVRWVLKIFFRKIYISGTEYIKSDTPQIIASNHPSGFMEPLIMACFFPKDLYFLVRGDVFENPFLKPLLFATHQIPVYRFKDGFSKLRENSSTVDSSSEVLSRGNSLLIFVEGSTKSIRMVRPLQKGMTRIAFETLHRYPDISIEFVPVGINFSHPFEAGKDVLLRVGPPVKLSAQDISESEVSKNKQETIIQGVYQGMKKNVIHFEKQDRVKSAEFVLELIWEYNCKKYAGKLTSVDGVADTLIKFASRWDEMPESQFVSWDERIRTLKQKLKKKGIKQNYLLAKKPKMIHWVILVAAFIPATAGFILNALPVIAGLWFTGLKVNQKEFRTSILMVSWVGFFLIYYLIAFVVGFWSSIVWCLAPVAILTGFVWLRYKSYMENFRLRNLPDIDVQYANLVKDLNKEFEINLFN